MIKLLAATLLALPSTVFAVGGGFGGSGGGFAQDPEAALNAIDPLTLTGQVILEQTPIVVGGSTVSTTSPIKGNGSDANPIDLIDCDADEILKYNGSTWNCAPDGGDGGGAGGTAHEYFKDDFTSLADGIETAFVMTTTAADNSEIVSLDGLTQRAGVDYTISLSPPTINFVTAPTAETTSLYVVYPSSVPLADVNAAANEQLMSISVGGTTNSTTYEVMKAFMFPGTNNTEGNEPVRFLANLYRTSGTGSCDFLLYDASNAVTIEEFIGHTNTDPYAIDEFLTPFANPFPASPSILEIQGRRVGGGSTTCALDYVTVVWK